MLIATLPTLTSSASSKLCEEIIEHPLIGAVRYNSGGDSPYTPKRILEILKPIADRHGKALYVDLEGRQIRVARWTPQSRGCVTLNRDFTIELPGSIHFRRAGWFDIVNSIPEERKIFFEPRDTRHEYYLGESQSVHIIAKNFEAQGYLGGLDTEYVKSAAALGIDTFMLSFVEGLEDIFEFYEAYYTCAPKDNVQPPSRNIVLKIESVKGVEFVEKLSSKMPEQQFALMAARDDLFLAFIDRRSEFLDALRLIAEKDKNAIVASRIMSGLEDIGEVTIGDMADIVLMSKLGYKHFMLSDELSHSFTLAMQDWEGIMMPLLGGEYG